MTIDPNDQQMGGKPMNCAIWKFAFEITDKFTLDIPDRAEFLDAQMQRETPCMWFLLDPKAPTVNRTFQVHGTGNPIAIPDGFSYLATFQKAEEWGQSYVWHLFEKTDIG